MPSERLPVPANVAVLLTGASAGIGHDAAMRLAENSFTVFATVRSQEHADKLINEAKKNLKIIESKGNLIPIQMDICRPETIVAARTQVGSELKTRGLQLLGIVNNAGISESGVVELMSQESLRRHFDTNVIGTIGVTQAFLPLLRQFSLPGGYTARVVIVSSIVGHCSVAVSSIYSATKMALEGVADGLRQEIAGQGIQVVKINPGVSRAKERSTSDIQRTRNAATLMRCNGEVERKSESNSAWRRIAIKPVDCTTPR